MNDVGKNYLYNVMTQILSLVVPIILVPYTSRKLGVDNTGIYSYMLSIVTVFSSIGRLGLNTYGQIQISQNRDDRGKLTEISWELIKLRLISTAVTILVYVIFIISFNQYRGVGILLITYLVADGIDIVWFFQGLEMYKYIAVRTAIIRVLNLVLVLMFVHGRGDLYKYIIVTHFTLILSNLILWTSLKRHIDFVNIFLLNSVKHLKFCLIYLIPTIANIVYNILDKTMLGFIGQSTYESGCYEQAYKIINIAQSIVLTIASTVVPRLTYYYKGNKNREYCDLLKRSLRIMYMLSFPIATGIFINSEIIVKVILGEEYYGSIDILRYLGVLLVFATFNYNVGHQVLVATENQKEYNTGVIAGSICNFVFNLVLIPRMAAKGAAIASLAAEIIITAFFMMFAGKHINHRLIFPQRLLRYFVAAVIMGMWCVFLKNIFGPAEMASGSIRLCVTVGSSAIIYFLMLLIQGERPISALFENKSR